jgi:hypothetical protein
MPEHSTPMDLMHFIFVHHNPVSIICQRGFYKGHGFPAGKTLRGKNYINVIISNRRIASRQ